MKNKILTLTATLFCLVMASPSYSQTVDSAYENSHYKRRMEFFDKVPTRKKSIVFLGNSLTEAGDFADILPGKHLLNRGISGDISFGVLARLDKILAGKPARIFLLIGVNDLKRGVPNELIVENYKKIVAKVTSGSPRTKLYLQSVLPINESLLIEPFKMVKMENIKYLNGALQDIAKQNKVVYVDLWKVLADEEGQLKKAFTPDGIHIKPVAYIDWIDYLKDLNYL